MKTKFILHGGVLTYNNPHNDSFFEEFTKDLKDGDRVLFIGFARRETDERQEIYERDKLFDHAAALAPQFQERAQRFADHPLVGEVRGVGLVCAVELVADKASKTAFDPAGKVGAECLSHCHANGLICRAIGDVMAFCPPLIITSEQVDEMFDKFEKAMAATLDWANGEGLLAA